MHMLFPYLDQLEIFAKRHGVDLMSACKLAGVAHTTLGRWRKGQSDPSLSTAESIQKAVLILSSAKIAA